jgi:hypothetical protein
VKRQKINPAGQPNLPITNLDGSEDDLEEEKEVNTNNDIGKLRRSIRARKGNFS